MAMTISSPITKKSGRFSIFRTRNYYTKIMVDTYTEQNTPPTNDHE